MSESQDHISRKIAWDMYYTGLVSISYHPGATRDGAIQRSLADCARMADEMLIERDIRFPP